MNLSKYKLLLFLFIYLIVKSISSGICATQDIYTECFDDISMIMYIQYFPQSGERTFYIQAPGIGFHSTNCLISYHFVVDDFEDRGYFNSKNRASELLMHIPDYLSGSANNCVLPRHLGSYTSQTNNYLRFYFAKLIRRFLTSWSAYTNCQFDLRLKHYFYFKFKQALNYSVSQSVDDVCRRKLFPIRHSLFSRSARKTFNPRPVLTHCSQLNDS